MKFLLILAQLVTTQLHAQKATATISWGPVYGAGAHVTFHTKEGPGFYLEAQSTFWKTPIDDNPNHYNNPEEIAKLFDAVRKYNYVGDEWDDSRLNLAFGIDIPIERQKLFAGVGLGMQKYTTSRRFSLPYNFEENSTYDILPEMRKDFYLSSETFTEYRPMLNGHLLYLSGRAAFKIGAGLNPHSFWANIGIGVNF